jgi:hypothetical protein
MFSETQQSWKFVKAATYREGEAPAEPSSWSTSSRRSGSAGASPSLQGTANDFPRTGSPDWLTDDAATTESVHGFFGSSHLPVMISGVFNTKHGAVQSESLDSALCQMFLNLRISPPEQIETPRNSGLHHNPKRERGNLR